MAEFQIKTETFEGPLELLLDLVEKKKLAINDVSLSGVADEYISHVKSLGELPLSSTTQFVLIASTLLLIKSLSLLPGLSLTPEEVGDIKELEARLALYQEVRRLAPLLLLRYGKIRIYWRGERGTIPISFTPGESLSQENILAAMYRAMASVPSYETVPEAVVKKVISLEEMLERLITRISSGGTLSFSEASGGKRRALTKEERQHVIITFLAVLELVKQEVLAAEQGSHFSDFTITKEVPVTM
jgi:segregation and condensation protein A